jgi:hypothetical protein
MPFNNEVRARVAPPPPAPAAQPPAAAAPAAPPAPAAAAAACHKDARRRRWRDIVAMTREEALSLGVMTAASSLPGAVKQNAGGSKRWLDHRWTPSR